MIKVGVLFIFLATLSAGLFLWNLPPRTVAILLVENGEAVPQVLADGEEPLSLPEISEVDGDNIYGEDIPPKIQDSERQKPLSKPPRDIKGVYVTNWSAGSSRISSLIEFIERNKLNAVVVDIKDYSGYVGYITDVPEVKKYRAEEARIREIHRLIKTLHDKGIYVIGRIAVFQDQQLIRARPDLVIKSKSSGKAWRDRKGLGWVDPASKEVWDYTIAIARDALSRGFDELNFDYIRFPSDGNIEDLDYPIWDGTVSKSETMRRFFDYLRRNLEGAVISADIFGQALVAEDDLGIGQRYEDFLSYFDYLSPMVYPSHFREGFLGYKNPAEHPYEVVEYAMKQALERLEKFRIRGDNMNQTSSVSSAGSENVPSLAVLRPWLQVFDLGAIYDAEKVMAQIRAWESAGGRGSGYLLWSPSNVYVDLVQ